MQKSTSGAALRCAASSAPCTPATVPAPAWPGPSSAPGAPARPQHTSYTTYTPFHQHTRRASLRTPLSELPHRERELLLLLRDRELILLKLSLGGGLLPLEGRRIHSRSRVPP